MEFDDLIYEMESLIRSVKYVDAGEPSTSWMEDYADKKSQQNVVDDFQSLINDFTG